MFLNKYINKEKKNKEKKFIYTKYTNIYCVKRTKKI